MKPILKRIFPFIIGGAVVVFAACQDNSQNLTEPGAAPLEARGGSPQSQINRAINTLWPGGDRDRSNAHDYKSDMFDAVGDGDDAAAQAAAQALIDLAAASGADPEDVAELIRLVALFSGMPTNAQFVEAGPGGTVTSNPELGPGLGFAGVEFGQNDLPEDVLVIIEQRSQPCHPLAQLPNQEDGCFSFRTVPELAAFVNPVLIGVCTDELAPNFPLLRLFESQGPNDNTPVVLLKEELTPAFLVPNCLGFGGMVSTESNWLGRFANASWDKVGRPLASLFAPQPAYATALVGRSGSLGGRTNNFSNIGWAEALVIDAMSYGSDGYLYMEHGPESEALWPPTDFETPGFDDSGWTLGGAPFWEKPGTANCAITPNGGVGTTWTAAGVGVVTNPTLFTEILLRRHFFLPGDASNVEVGIAIDNDVQVWVNGVEVSGGVRSHEGCATEDSFVFSVDIGDVTQPGMNLLVVRGIDRGVMSYVDAQVTFLGHEGGAED